MCNGCHPEFPDITLCNLNPTNLLNEFSGEIVQLDEYLYVVQSYKSVDHEEVFGTSDIDRLTDIFKQMFSLTGYFHNINKMQLFQRMVETGFVKHLVLFCEW